MVGEHIRILKGGRWVHAVDCGDETVLHLAEESPPPRVRRAYRPEFVAGASAVEVVTHRERTFPASEIVRRAYSRASDPALAAMFRDSEAFVEWCTTGRLSGARNVALEPTAGATAPAPLPAAATSAPAAAPAKPRPSAAAAKRASKRSGKAARAKAAAKPRTRAGAPAKPAGRERKKKPAVRRAAPRKSVRRTPARRVARAKAAPRGAKTARRGRR